MKALLMDVWKPTRPRYYPAHITKGAVRIQGVLPGQRKRVTSRGVKLGKPPAAQQAAA